MLSRFEDIKGFKEAEYTVILSSVCALLDSSPLNIPGALRGEVFSQAERN